MKRVVGPYTFELANDMVMIKETGSGNLLKAVTYKPAEAVDRFHAIVKHWEAKLRQPMY
jgi:hypothetical protein